MFDENTGTVFRDILTLALAGFVAIVILLLPWVNPPGRASEADVNAPGDVVFEAVWPSGLDTDVDQWVLAPEGVPVGYSNKGNETCNLLRDDLGHQADSDQINHEMTVCRGIGTTGEYVMNLHLFSDRSGALPIPVEVKVSVRAPGGAMREILSSSVQLGRLGNETTVVRFRLDENGGLVPDSVHSLFMPLRAAAAG
jgi:hypothetical protein